jgi:hypothetical protein
MEHMIAPEPTSARRRGPGLRDMWQHQSPPLQGGEVQGYMVRGSAWMHALLLVLALSLYMEVPNLQGTNSGPEPTLGEVASP